MNCLVLLHVHKEGTDALDMQAVLAEFIGEYLLDLLLAIGLLSYRVLCYLKGSKVSRLCLNEYCFHCFVFGIIKLSTARVDYVCFS